MSVDLNGISGNQEFVDETTLKEIENSVIENLNTISQDALSFEVNHEQAAQALNAIENESETRSESNSEPSEMVSHDLSNQSTTVETASDFCPVNSFDSEDNLSAERESNHQSEAEDHEQALKNGRSDSGEKLEMDPDITTPSSSEDAVTQFWVHRNPEPDVESAASIERETSLNSGKHLPNDDSDEITSDFSNQLSPLQEASDASLDGTKLEEDSRPSEPEPPSENISPYEKFLIGTGEDKEDEMDKNEADATLISDNPPSESVLSSHSRLDLVWDTDIPSEFEQAERPSGSVQNKSQHSLERFQSPSDGQKKIEAENSQQNSPYASEIDSLTVFNNVELNPLPKRPVNSFGGTFKENGDDSLVETTWDSESVTSQKDVPSIPIDSEYNERSNEQVVQPPEQTPINESAPTQTVTHIQDTRNSHKLESKLQISISTDVMDCTIHADNLPLKQNKITRTFTKESKTPEVTSQDNNTDSISRNGSENAQPKVELSNKMTSRKSTNSRNNQESREKNVPEHSGSSAGDEPKNIWAVGLRDKLYERETSRPPNLTRNKRITYEPSNNAPKNEQSLSRKKQMAKLCSHHDHQELHLCCMPPAPEYNFTPRIEQVKREVTQRSLSVDSSNSSCKKFNLPQTRRRVPSNASTPSDVGESSVFESDSARTSGRFGNYRTYNGRKRNESSSRDCPSDAESVTSVASSTNSRIPRYIGRSSRADSESSKLSERDVKQIVKLVKGGDRKVGNRLSPEFVIKKDPVSKKWQLRDSSSDLRGSSAGNSSRERSPAFKRNPYYNIEDDEIVSRSELKLSSSVSANRSKRQSNLLTQYGVGFLLGLLVAAVVRYVVAPTISMALKSGNNSEETGNTFGDENQKADL